MGAARLWPGGGFNRLSWVAVPDRCPPSSCLKGETVIMVDIATPGMGLRTDDARFC